MSNAEAVKSGSTSGAPDQAGVADSGLMRHQSPALPDEDELTNYNWLHVAGGIILAGGAYPIVLGVFAILFTSFGYFWGLLAGPQGLPTSGDFAGMAMAAIYGGIVFGVIGGLIGMCWSLAITIPTFPFVYFFVRSMKLRGSIVWFGAIWGGLVGFWPCCRLRFRYPFRCLIDPIRTHCS